MSLYDCQNQQDPFILIDPHANEILLCHKLADDGYISYTARNRSNWSQYTAGGGYPPHFRIHARLINKTAEWKKLWARQDANHKLAKAVSVRVSHIQSARCLAKMTELPLEPLIEAMATFTL